MGTPGENSGGTLYSNPLTGPDDVADWIAEGPVSLGRHPETHDDGGTPPAADPRPGALLLSGSRDDEEFGDHAHWTFWCPVEFPDRVRVSWEFLPLAEPGLAMVFFSAAGHGGRDLFSGGLAPRTGFYPQYHSGDIDTLHVSYFRHKYAEERAFRTCNLRKSAGFELVAQAPTRCRPRRTPWISIAWNSSRTGRTLPSPSTACRCWRGGMGAATCWAAAISASGRWPRCGLPTGTWRCRRSRLPHSANGQIMTPKSEKQVIICPFALSQAAHKPRPLTGP